MAGVVELLLLECSIRDLAMAKKLALETICRFDPREVVLSILTIDFYVTFVCAPFRKGA